MKDKLIPLVKLISIDLDEAVLNINLGPIIFHSIEWRRKGNQVILHRFKGNIDYEFNYDEIGAKLQKDVYLFLLREFLN